MKKDKWIAIGVVLFFVIGFVWATSSSNKTSSSKTNTSSSKTSEIVVNSEWDASVYQVKNYLKENLKDPDSYQSIEWSKVVKNSDGTFVVRHKFRAKNGFGGYGIENKIFKLNSSGIVISVLDY